MLPATSSGEAARAVLLDAASREPRVPHSELRRMLRNTSITSPADVRLRSDYIDAAGKRPADLVTTTCSSTSMPSLDHDQILAELAAASDRPSHT